MTHGSRRAAWLLLSLLSTVATAAPPAHHPAPQAPSAMVDLPVDKLLELQDGLVRQAVDALPPRVPGHPNIYALGIAASGRQQLFSREAHLALQVIAQRFGAEYRGGMLLSNGAPDLTHTPVATRGNTILALSGLGHRADPAEDVAFLYLASHGAPDASLETDLPNLEPFSPISAASLAQALKQSGVKRRIIVISACFAGSWIPALADDDTILITAARYDRTSFGCDDRRPLTYFGAAFLQGPLARGASLAETFEAARASVAKWEAKERFLPSDPQVFVGRNMAALWTATGAH